MTTSVEPRETTRGAESGPPAAVSPKPAPIPPRIGPLPEPTLVERLRSSWSLAALVPAFDRDEARKRDWRPAATLALALHTAVFFAIVIVGKYAFVRFVEPDRAVMLDISKRDIQESEPQPTDGGGEPAKDENSAGATSSGGGSNTDTKPVTPGPPPPTSPAPVLPPSVTPPLVTPSLPVPQTVQAPVDIPPPSTPPGLVGAPPAPDVSSLGNQGDIGVGMSPGNHGVGNDPVGGPGGDGPPGPGGKGPGPDPAASRNGIGPGTGLDDRPAAPNTPDHGVKLIRKIKPILTQAMIDNQTFGTVLFRVTIAADGSIASAEPLQTVANGGTDAARAALYRCRFEPAVKAGKYVADTIVVRFDIRNLGDN